MIGLVVPLLKEANPLLAQFNSMRTITLNGRKLFRGRIGRTPCALLICGTGTVAAAAGTQLLIDNFRCAALFHFGAAGSLRNDLSKGQLVVADRVIKHDHHWRFGQKKEFPPSVRCDRKLINLVQRRARELGLSAVVGTVVSGDEDIVTASRRIKLARRFNAIAVDWESAACAMVCRMNEVPVSVIRVISDHANSKTADDYQTTGKAARAILGKCMTDVIQEYY